MLKERRDTKESLTDSDIETYRIAEIKYHNILLEMENERQEIVNQQLEYLRQKVDVIQRQKEIREKALSIEQGQQLLIKTRSAKSTNQPQAAETRDPASRLESSHQQSRKRKPVRQLQRTIRTRMTSRNSAR